VQSAAQAMKPGAQRVETPTPVAGD
jgi:hypothetical protein